MKYRRQKLECCRSIANIFDTVPIPPILYLQIVTLPNHCSLILPIKFNDRRFPREKQEKNRSIKRIKFFSLFFSFNQQILIDTCLIIYYILI